LKGLFLLSNPNKDSSSNSNQKTNSKNSKPNSDRSQSNNLANTNMNSLNSVDDPELMELDQYASNVLQEICEHDWIKERCFNEGDNLLKTNQLLEPALGRRAQSLLHIICYPRNHHLRKQNEQSSTKDFIKTILQNLDIWTLRESLLEFKLMIELQKQKDNHYVRNFRMLVYSKR
jgi:mediator of RNA polymerase II transcription subunit 12